MSAPDTSTLVLTTSRVKELVTMKDAIDSLREVYREHHRGRTKTYPRLHVPFDQYDGSISYMVSAVDSLGASAAKIIGLYGNNPAKGLPRLMSVVVLSSIEDGRPLAIIDGNYLTMLRTGAIGGLAAEYLASKDADLAGILGAGLQGRGQLMGLCQVRSLKEILVFDLVKSAAQRFADEASKRYGLKATVVDSPEAMKDCDILAAATPSKTPVITDRLLHPGLHINSVGIGSGGFQKQEVDFRILRKLRVVVEDAQVATEETLAGAVRKGLFSSKDIYGTIGQLVSSEKQGRTGEEVTAFFAGGMAIQDLAIAQLAYSKARTKGVGDRIDFND